MKYVFAIVLCLVICCGGVFLMNSPARAEDDFVRIKGDHFNLNGRDMRFKGSNYYPRSHMWADMWSSWDWGVMTSESDMMKNLGLNCVRILVPYSNGGWNGPNVPTDHLDNLENLVNMLGSKGIKSCITLFDWETSYPSAGTTKEADHIKYLNAIVGRLKNNKNVFMWDVKNEPDHPSAIKGYDNWDYAPTEKAKIVSWLQRMCNAVRAVDPNHPAAPGLRWYENVKDVIGFSDIAIFHSYWRQLAEQQITVVKGYMGTNQKPILCEEFGWPSAPTPCNRDGAVIWDYNEQEQLNSYVAHLSAFEKYNIAGCIQWMTFDARSYGSDPNVSFENFFGLWRYDYSLKPAGEYYRDHFAIIPPVAAPAPATYFRAFAGDGLVRLSWTNPASSQFEGTMVRMKTTGYPATPTDGVLVCSKAAAPGSDDSFLYSSVVNGQRYYFSAFAYSYQPSYAISAYASCTPSAVTCAQAKALPEGTWTSLRDKTVTAAFSADNCLYIEEPNRSAGIRIDSYDSQFTPGSLVNVSGFVTGRKPDGTNVSERVISSPSITKKAGTGTITPVMMSCSAVGGAASGIIPGVQDGTGPNNIGLLVRLTGKVTYIEGNDLYIDDGSAKEYIPGKKGVIVRCSFPSSLSVGNVVMVTGVVEGYFPPGWTTNARCIHIRTSGDITRLN